MFKKDRIYSTLVLLVFFVILLAQLFVPDMKIDTISENYLWRHTLIQNFRRFEIWIGDRVFTNALVGKEGWVFLTTDMTLRNYQKVPMSNGDIKDLIYILERIDQEVRSYGGSFLVVVPPDKSTIYPQYMPNEIPLLGTETSMDRLVRQVETNSHIQLLDLRPALMRAAETSQVYYKTDTHWNCIGAYNAYNEIVTYFSDEYPFLQPHALSDFDIVYSEENRLDISVMMEVDVPENMMSVTSKFLPNPSSELDVMIFHDSFYEACLNEFMEPTFSQISLATYKDIELAQALEMIKSEKPDLVILEFVERFMDFVLTHFIE